MGKPVGRRVRIQTPEPLGLKIWAQKKGKKVPSKTGTRTHRKNQIVVEDDASTSSNVTIVDDHRKHPDSQTGPMFYVENTLSRKGKLALVWLAAHWEKKLSRNQIVTADLVEAINAICGPDEVPMALRLQGHLLLGLARLYSRQIKYLLHDGNDALIKIKMAFRVETTGATTGENTVASYASITLRADALPLEFFGQDGDDDSILMMTDADDLIAPYESITLARNNRLGPGVSSLAIDPDDDFGWRGPAALETVSIEQVRRDQHETSVDEGSRTMGAPLVGDGQFEKSFANQSSSSNDYSSLQVAPLPGGDQSFVPMLDEPSMRAELLDSSRQSLGGLNTSDLLFNTSMMMGDPSLGDLSTSVVAFPDPIPILPTSLAVRPAPATTETSAAHRVRVDGRSMITTAVLNRQITEEPVGLIRPEALLAPTSQRELQQMFQRQNEIDSLFSNPAFGLAPALGAVFNTMLHLPLTETTAVPAASSIMGSPAPFDRSSMLPEVEEFRGAVDNFPSSLSIDHSAFGAAGAEQIGEDYESFVAPMGDFSKSHLPPADVVTSSQIDPQTEQSQRDAAGDDEEAETSASQMTSSQRPATSFTKRTRQVLNFLRVRAQKAAETPNEFGEVEDLKLLPILQGRTRAVAANTFFELLVLNSHGRIDLTHSAGPYSDVAIKITA